MSIEQTLIDIANAKKSGTLNETEIAYLDKILEEIAAEGRSTLYDRMRKQDFVREPVSPREFFTSPYYMGKLAGSIYPKWLEELETVCDPNNEITEWIITGPIGGGKTATAANVVAYKIYYLSCLLNPQEYFGLMAGSQIVIGLFTVFKYKVRSTSYHYLDNIVTQSPYFKGIFQRDSKYSTSLHFPYSISVIAGSEQVHMLGENLYVLVIDEANFMKGGQSEEEGQAYELYTNALRRMKSRFLSDRGIMPWLIVNVSSKKHETDFTAHRIKLVEENPHAHVSDFPVWELKPKGTFASGKFFVVQLGDVLRPSRILAENEEPEKGLKTTRVPEEYREDFENDLESALNDIAGITVSGIRPLVTLREKIAECLDERKHPFFVTSVYSDFLEPDPIEGYVDVDYLTRIQGCERIPRINPHVPRNIHVDIGLTGDALGFAMGHKGGTKLVTRRDQDGIAYQTEETKVIIDLMLQIVPKNEIDLEAVRLFILFLRDSLGFMLNRVTYDGFQSRGSMQELQKSGVDSAHLSVDAKIDPYMCLQRAILEGRIEFYSYSIFLTELTNLILDKSKKKIKIDHPQKNPDGSKGSKDVSDAVAAVTFNSIVLDTNLPYVPVTEREKSNSKYVDVSDFSWIIGADNPEGKQFIKRYIGK